MAYRKQFVIRWSECDLNGHARNTAYSEFGIDTRVSYLAERGFTYARFVEHAIGPVIQREEIDYLAELHLGDAIEVDLKSLGTSPEGGRFKLAHEFWGPGGKRVARIVLQGGWLDLRKRRLTAPPPELLHVMGSMERADPYEELPPIRRQDA